MCRPRLEGVLFALIFYIAFMLIGCLAREISTNCLSDPGNEVECSSAVTGDCILTEQPSPPMNIEDDRPPNNNTRSRFRTCNSLFAELEVCEADRIRFENNSLINVNGPLPSTDIYNYYKVFSRQFQNQRPYPPNELALYDVVCNSDDVIAVTFDTHDLRPISTNPNYPGQCVDFVDLMFPLGQDCRTCGSELTNTCEEILERRSGTRPVDRIHYFSGLNPFRLQFRSNRVPQSAFGGFQFLVSCVAEDYFCFRNCTIPDRGRVSKRSTSMNSLDELVPSLFRGRRSYRLVKIIVTEEAAVSYSDFTVKVFRGDIWLYKFPNTRIFQVFNFVEGFATFTRNAFVFSRNITAPPVIRIFPGYGILKIGRGIIQYIQTGVDPRFLPSPAETEIILGLRRRIIEAPELLDEDPVPPDEGDPTTDPIRTPREFTAAEIAQLDADAIMFGSACNGILRADACVYQQLFFGKVSADCLTDIGLT